MGGYQISYESFETYIRNQARIAKDELERADEDENYTTRAASYIGSAEGREAAVFELAKYLSVPEKKVKRIWEEA